VVRAPRPRRRGPLRPGEPELLLLSFPPPLVLHTFSERAEFPLGTVGIKRSLRLSSVLLSERDEVDQVVAVPDLSIATRLVLGLGLLSVSDTSCSDALLGLTVQFLNFFVHLVFTSSILQCALVSTILYRFTLLPINYHAQKFYAPTWWP
jgi:hypothetical protein